MHKSSGARQQPVFASRFTHSLRISFLFNRRRCIEERRSSNKNINKLRWVGGPVRLTRGGFKSLYLLSFSVSFVHIAWFGLFQHCILKESRPIPLHAKHTNCTMGCLSVDFLKAWSHDRKLSFKNTKLVSNIEYARAFSLCAKVCSPHPLLLRRSTCYVLAIKRQNGFQTMHISKESREFMASQWISSIISNVLCLFITTFVPCLRRMGCGDLELATFSL
jgi:hypothetical protein